MSAYDGGRRELAHVLKVELPSPVAMSNPCRPMPGYRATNSLAAGRRPPEKRQKVPALKVKKRQRKDALFPCPNHNPPPRWSATAARCY